MIEKKILPACCVQKPDELKSWKAAWTAGHSLKGRRRESFHCPRGVGYATHFLERREIDVGILIMLLLLLSYPFYRSSLFSAWCLYAVLLYIFFFLSFYDNHIFLILSLSLSSLCYSFIYSFYFFSSSLISTVPRFSIYHDFFLFL